MDIKSYGVGIKTSSGIETSNAAEPDDETSEEEDNTPTVQDEAEKIRDQEEAEKIRDQEQVIAQSIVFGWTQYNRHPDKSADIPTIYMDSEKFGVLIYNPEADSLLISQWPILFFSKFSDHSYNTLADKWSGIFILWVFMNHRMFFKKQITASRMDCGFKTLMAQDIEFYKQLKSYSNCIKIRTRGFQWNRGILGICAPEQPDKGIKRKSPE